MNRTVKKIPRVNIADAVKLSAFELNKIHFSGKKTVLTPELLEKIASGKKMMAGS